MIKLKISLKIEYFNVKLNFVQKVKKIISNKK